MNKEQKELIVLKAIMEGADYQYKIYMSCQMTRLTVMEMITRLQEKNLITVHATNKKRMQTIKPTTQGIMYYNKMRELLA